MSLSYSQQCKAANWYDRVICTEDEVRNCVHSVTFTCVALPFTQVMYGVCILSGQYR
jgi:hypothetical protein